MSKQLFGLFALNNLLRIEKDPTARVVALNVLASFLPLYRLKSPPPPLARSLCTLSTNGSARTMALSTHSGLTGTHPAKLYVHVP